ncbi:DNA processing protein SMF [Metamycoplasma cloacale]|uniref:Smf/DprA SLOG domain-containing protein n=1 Tax=Metamycoplasma cloacale TaxID=92401 RepID=A0A2Z4LM61_9BACT|nr:DNA-processing protein DprA [Metamycoplasma cloacale]AWX42862.1 hypothetical protein DK849_02195 [Metamycoplasma cloacale]VEU79316.1 DNA processing protein SMF [Metamycoplasma cloacale]
MNEYLLYFVYKYKGNWDEIYHALKNFELIDSDYHNQIKKQQEMSTSKYVTVLDDGYPDVLVNADKMPFLIFYRGDLKLLDNNNIVCLTGNLISKNTLELLKEIEKIDQEVTFVSLLWKGLDELIVKKILENPKLKLVLIAPSGLNKLEIDFIDKKDYARILLISEYPDDYHAVKKSFYDRNRLLNAIAKKLVLLGTKDNLLYSIIDYFIANHKEIECFMTNESDVLNNNIELINNGAKMITNLNGIVKHK